MKNKLGVDYKAKFLQSLRYMEILETELIALRQETEELRSFKEFVSEHDNFYLTKFEEAEKERRVGSGGV
jgi:hypothetical protein